MPAVSMDKTEPAMPVRALRIGAAAKPDKTIAAIIKIKAIFMEKDDSLASAAFLLLGMAKKVIPNALTKQAAASPPVRASKLAQTLKKY